MLSRTISEQPEALSVAWEAAVKVQVEDLLVRSDTRDGAGAAAPREHSAARPKSLTERMMNEGMKEREFRSTEQFWSVRINLSTGKKERKDRLDITAC